MNKAETIEVLAYYQITYRTMDGTTGKTWVLATSADDAKSEFLCKYDARIITIERIA